MSRTLAAARLAAAAGRPCGRATAHPGDRASAPRALASSSPLRVPARKGELLRAIRGAGSGGDSARDDCRGWRSGLLAGPLALAKALAVRFPCP
jgi:hypothetical protein